MKIFGDNPIVNFNNNSEKFVVEINKDKVKKVVKAAAILGTGVTVGYMTKKSSSKPPSPSCELDGCTIM